VYVSIEKIVSEFLYLTCTNKRAGEEGVMHAAQKERREEHPLIKSSIEQIRAAKGEMREVRREVSEQGEKIGAFYTRVLETESLLRRTSRVIERLSAKSKKRAFLVVLILSITLFVVVTMKINRII
jgi:outer membrane protein assembly factor BamD (BamD/ComL family)